MNQCLWYPLVDSVYVLVDMVSVELLPGPLQLANKNKKIRNSKLLGSEFKIEPKLHHERCAVGWPPPPSPALAPASRFQRHRYRPTRSTDRHQRSPHDVGWSRARPNVTGLQQTRMSRAHSNNTRAAELQVVGGTVA